MLARGEITAAEQIAQSILTRGENADALHLMGVVRVQQQRLEDGVTLMAQSLALEPRQPHTLLNFGKTLSLMGLHSQAAIALAEAVRLEPSMTDGWFELANRQAALGEADNAETSYRRVLAQAPGHGAALLQLCSLLIAVNRAREAEVLLLAAASHVEDAQLAAAIAQTLALAQRQQGRKQDALETLTRITPVAANRTDVKAGRVYLLDDLGRHAEALGLLEEMLAREPLNVSIHNYYNDLLYRLGRDKDFLTSYDKAPSAPALQLDKARLLLSTGRLEEAHAIYSEMAAKEPGNRAAVEGVADTLGRLSRYTEALDIYDASLARAPDDPGLLIGLAGTALRAGDPERAAQAAQKALAANPIDQNGLALLGTAWRMMQDERDESLSGYDTLIRIFDLEPPEGFSSMAEFNAELADYLARQHPPTREFINQSLRGGTQTRGVIFNTGHDLVDRLQARISEAVTRYIAEMPPDPAHPFLSRRRKDFAYSGSWSSRLKDCGYHVNHFHPAGWISSCYYVGVPDAAEDQAARQGWIKFGEPPFETGLGIRRAVQPVPGRLVLFPSYMWHGTIPFHSEQVRTTIAFDAVPR